MAEPHRDKKKQKPSCFADIVTHALSLPCVAAMLDAKTAWRLDRTSRRVVVCWEEIRVHTKCKMPRALGAGLSANRKWNVDAALALLDDAAETPFKTKANMLRHFFRYALFPMELYEVGQTIRHIATMRLALRLNRKWIQRHIQPLYTD